jgi:hypothetical protein
MNLIDRIPTPGLIAATLLMVLAPFSPQPHLLEKYFMLMAGTLNQPIDLFDVLWHLLPAIVLAIKIYRQRMQSA